MGIVPLNSRIKQFFQDKKVSLHYLKHCWVFLMWTVWVRTLLPVYESHHDGGQQVRSSNHHAKHQAEDETWTRSWSWSWSESWRQKRRCEDKNTRSCPPSSVYFLPSFTCFLVFSFIPLLPSISLFLLSFLPSFYFPCISFLLCISFLPFLPYEEPGSTQLLCSSWCQIRV